MIGFWASMGRPSRYWTVRGLLVLGCFLLSPDAAAPGGWLAALEFPSTPQAAVYALTVILGGGAASGVVQLVRMADRNRKAYEESQQQDLEAARFRAHFESLKARHYQLKLEEREVWGP